MELFNQVLDQTLYDYRRSAQTGKATANEAAMSKNEYDIFFINLKTLLDNVYGGSLGTIRAYELGYDLIRADMVSQAYISPDVIGSRLKDILKFGMLRWWNSTRDLGLFEKYTLDYENTLSKLKQQLTGVITRPYSYF